MSASDSTQQESIALQNWANFPSNIEDWSSSIFGDDPRSRRLCCLVDKIFFKKTVEVEVINVHKDGLVSKKAYKNEGTLLCDLQQRLIPGVRVLSIAQDHSLTPLDVTYQCMMKIMTVLKVSPDFLSVLLKFGRQPQIFEEGSTVASASVPLPKCFDICYQLTYTQENGRTAPDDPWSVRQTGVYHRVFRTPNGYSSTVILLHPTPLAVSEAQKRLRQLESSTKRAKLIESNPFSVHLNVLACYLHNWQTYLELLVSQFRGLRGRIAEIDIDRGRDLDLQTTTLRKLKEIEDRLLFRVSANVRSNIAIVEVLLKACTHLQAIGAMDEEHFADNTSYLQSFLNRLKSHQSSAGTLEKRLSATIGLLSNLLDLKNQKAAGVINDNMLALTEETVDDSATVFVISLVTLIYLPSQWIATLFGMNFFEYEQSNNGFKVSPSVWIYFCVAAPLTTFTIIAWRVLARGKKLQRGRQRKRIEDG